MGGSAENQQKIKSGSTEVQRWISRGATVDKQRTSRALVVNQQRIIGGSAEDWLWISCALADVLQMIDCGSTKDLQ